MPPVLIDTFHEFILQTSIPASVGPNQHMATHILVFTVTVCYSWVVMCSLIQTHNPLAWPRSVFPLYVSRPLSLM